jgi:CHAT domain-containing protein
VLHFATDGTLAGEISGTAEPGLILTPPKQATDLDDGYLSASEVAGLKLDADWVILSACNTAAGGRRTQRRSPAWPVLLFTPVPERYSSHTGR